MSVALLRSKPSRIERIFSSEERELADVLTALIAKYFELERASADGKTVRATNQTLAAAGSFTSM
jgi:hypothetical protein